MKLTNAGALKHFKNWVLIFIKRTGIAKRSFLKPIFFTVLKAINLKSLSGSAPNLV